MKALASAVLLVLLSSFAFAQPAATPAVEESRSQLEWRPLPDLPDFVGLGGPVVGVHRDVLIVAGGANFPAGPPWSIDGHPPGTKVWHDQIYVLHAPPADGQVDPRWIRAGRLPRPLAYAATVSRPEGVYVLGGETWGQPDADGPASNFPVDEVLRLSWNPRTQQVDVETGVLPPLPRPSQYHAATLLGDDLYVVASHARSIISRVLDEKSMWRISLAPKEHAEWIDCPVWPGAAREKMAFVTQNSGADEEYGSVQSLYLFGGATWARHPDGTPDDARATHFTDNYRYHPRSRTWSRIADFPFVPESRTIDLAGYEFQPEHQSWIRSAETGSASPRSGHELDDLFGRGPRPLAAAPAISVGQSHVLLFSGATGHYVTLDTQDRPPFPREVLSYHTITDRWNVVGEMPIGVVTTSAVQWNGRIVIPTGEVRPGVRTPKVQALSLVRTPKFSSLDWWVLGAYLAALVVIGVWFSRRETGTDDYFLAGRRIPWWAAGISIYVTQLSAITFLGLPSVPYATNWLIYPGQLMIFAFAPVVVIFYLPFFRRLNVTTAYEYLERRFSLPVRLVGSLAFIGYQLARMGVVVYFPALALSTVMGMDIYLAIVLMGVLATLYTVLGGMEAVIWTDVLQVIVLWGGMLLALGMIFHDTGGIAAAFQLARDDHKLTTFNWTWQTGQLAAWIVLLGNVIQQFGPYTTDQAVIQRYLTTQDERSAARGILLNGLLVLPFSTLFFVLGTGLYAYYAMHSDQLSLGMKNDEVFPLFVASRLPAGLSGLVIAGVFAASMSSLDSSMHSVATALTTDFYRRFRPQASDRSSLRLARLLTVAAGLLGTVVALWLATRNETSLFLTFQAILGLATSGVAAMFLLGILTQRANTFGVLTGAAASVAVLVWVTTSTDLNLFLYSVVCILTAVIVGYTASLLRHPPRQDLTGLTWWTRLRSEP